MDGYRDCAAATWQRDRGGAGGESSLAAVGDPVTKGELIAIVATPKVTLKIESSKSGVLKAIHVPADELAAVGAVLGVIEAA